MSDASDSPPPSPPVVSMTGSGVANGETEFGNTTVELRSVNGRTLGLKFRLPAVASGLEATIERAVQALCTFLSFKFCHHGTLATI